MEGSAFYYFDQAANRTRGPFPLSQMEEFAETGVIHRHTLVAHTGSNEWTAVQDWPELSELLFPAAHLHLRTEANRFVEEGPAAYETDAYAVLGVNRSREDPDRVILTEEDIHPKMPRKYRDFLWGFFGGNLLMVGGTALYTLLFGVNVVVLMFGLGMAIIWSVGLSWITFGVMGRW